MWRTDAQVDATQLEKMIRLTVVTVIMTYDEHDNKAMVSQLHNYRI